MTPKTIRALIVVCGLLLFVPTLGGGHLFDWDEVNFAECAREMIVSGDYLHVTVDYAPFHEKPPLFIWLQALSMLAFGVNEFAARLPNAIIGIATLLVIFNIGLRLKDKRFGLLWVCAYAGSLLPQFYIHSAIIDPLFNLLIFLSLYYLFRYRDNPRSVYLAGLFSGLAVLTKGPVGWGLIMLTLCITWLVERRSYAFPLRQILVVTTMTIAVFGLWLMVDFVQNGPAFITEHLAYQLRLLTSGEAGHAQPFYYHSLVLLVGCYPASIIFFKALKSDAHETPQQHAFRLWQVTLFFVVLVVFSVVKTKIVHYSSMTYLPMTFLAAVAMQRWLSSTQQWGKIITAALITMSVICTVAAAIVPLAFMNSEWLLTLPTFRDPFLRATMTQHVPWQGYEPLISLLILVGAVLAVVWMRVQSRRVQVICVLFGSVLCFVLVFLPLVAPRVEQYTQGAAVNFYSSMRGKDVYVKPLTMKSYAHLFYTQKPFELSATAKHIDADAWEPWLLEGTIDHPAFFVARVNDAGRWREHKNLRVISESGGFVFFERVNVLGLDQQHQNH